MTVEKDRVVSIDYTLKDSKGSVIDSSEGGSPLSYIHGNGNLIPGLEKELQGKDSGAKLKVVVQPAEGYGERNEEMVFVVPRSQFEAGAKLEIGMQFETETEGGFHVFTVAKIEDDEITVDGNHPLAGQTLYFDVSIVNIREATAEELAHGHTHDECDCDECDEDCDCECEEGCDCEEHAEKE